MMLFRKEKKFENLVFIIGCPRSGTSWTWGLLSSFRQVEPLLIEDFPELSKRNRIKQMKTEEGFVTTETAIFHRRLLTDKEIRRGIAGKARKHPGAILLEKTPRHALKLKRITALFPEAKIIHVIRDPRAVINSVLQTEFTGGHKAAHSLEEAISLYRQYFDATEPYKNHENLVRLQYESLSREPVRELSSICEFIGLDAGLDEIEAVVKKNTGKSQTVSSNDFRKGQVDSYKEELSRQDIARIEQELADILEVYGYPLQ